VAAAAAAVQASAGAAVGMRSLKKKGVTSSSIAEVEKTEGKVQGKGNGDGLASAEVRHADLRRNARRDVIASFVLHQSCRPPTYGIVMSLTRASQHPRYVNFLCRERMPNKHADPPSTQQLR
jgi:hypothetical protein